MQTRKIAVLTSGGDSPGMNATIYGFVANALTLGFEPYIIHNGYQGLIDDKIYPVTLNEAKEHLDRAGSFIGSCRSLEYQNDLEARKRGLNNLKKRGIDNLFIIGGDGSYKGAQHMVDLGVSVITAPGTIDNDVSSSGFTIGFLSAMSEIREAVTKIRATSRTHNQVVLIEAMGRHCVDLSVLGGIVSGVDAVVTNQNLFQVKDFIQVVKKARANGSKEVIFLVTELTYGPEQPYKLPSLSEVADAIYEGTGLKCKVNVLNYLQRGHEPSTFEILQAVGFGRKAVELLNNNQKGLAIGSNGCSYYTTELALANSQPQQAHRKNDIQWQNNLVNLKQN